MAGFNADQSTVVEQGANAAELTDTEGHKPGVIPLNRQGLRQRGVCVCVIGLQLD
jgi:hypothetical protein